MIMCCVSDSERKSYQNDTVTKMFQDQKVSVKIPFDPYHVKKITSYRVVIPNSKLKFIKNKIKLKSDLFEFHPYLLSIIFYHLTINYLHFNF